MVAYWVGADETFVWVVDRTGKLHSHRIAVSRQTLVRLIRETQPFVQPAASPGKPSSAVTRGTSPVTLASGDAAWRRLYSLLIAPITQFLPRTPGALLTIVPHGVLNSVSFAALKSPRGRYLLEDFTLHYAPTGGLFQFTAPRRHPDARGGSVLLVADPAPPRRSTLDEDLPRLPGTRAESAAIAGYAGRGRATLLQDAAATEAQVRDLASARTVLHFATHAIVLEDKPFDSHLLLAQSGDGAASDGVLTAQELYGMRLNADLVVLSACRSAAGVTTGEAMATFTRAFLYAGTASLVASLWDVADEPTNLLIPSFYQAWYSGADKASALRRAQLRLLAELRAGRVRVTTAVGPVPLPEHPVFWAGFVSVRRAAIGRACLKFGGERPSSRGIVVIGHNPGYAPRPEPSTPMPMTDSRPRVLVVEDRAHDRLYLTNLLGDDQFVVSEAANGEEGLALAASRDFDLIISDVLMPKMDGFEFVRQLRRTAAGADVPVLFHTATFHEQSRASTGRGVRRHRRAGQAVRAPGTARESRRGPVARAGCGPVHRRRAVRPPAHQPHQRHVDSEGEGSRGQRTPAGRPCRRWPAAHRGT